MKGTFLHLFVQESRQVAHPSLTKAFLWMLNWYQLNVVNRNRVLPALGVINFVEGGTVSSAHVLQPLLTSWPRAGAKQCLSAPPSQPVIFGPQGLHLAMLFILFSTGVLPGVGGYLLTGLL